MLRANKLLYIGSGLHIKPVVDFLKTKNFVFIDTLPRTEFSENNIKISYNKYFYNNLIDKFRNYKFELNSETKLVNENDNDNDNTEYRIYPTLLIFNNIETKQTVNYYISTNFLYIKNKNLIQDIAEADGLIISSYYPDKKLLNYFTFPKKLFCYNDNLYNYIRDHWFDDEYDSSIFSLLDKDNQHLYFNEFNLIIHDGNILNFNSLDELKIANKKKY
jgi:hypothetical protein